MPLSLWALAWVGGQFVEGGTVWSPLDVLRSVTGRFGAPEPGWLAVATAWARDPEHRALLGWVAVAAGLVWAATSEFAQLPALVGWALLMVSAEGIGYGSAMFRAGCALICFVALLSLVALRNRARMVVRRVRLLPKDVLRAGVLAAALSLMVPLLVPGLAFARLLRPYLTRPARPDPSRATLPTMGDNGVIPAPRVAGEKPQATPGSPARHGRGRAQISE